MHHKGMRQNAPSSLLQPLVETLIINIIIYLVALLVKSVAILPERENRDLSGHHVLTLFSE